MNVSRVLIITGLLVLAAGPARAQLPDVEDIKNRLPEVTVKETVIDVSPRTRLYLPSGALDLNLRQGYQRALVTFSSRYDFVDNFMGFNLDALYDLAPFDVGLNLRDRVDFNELLSNSEYLQRSQAMTPYAQYAFTRSTKLRLGLRFENTYTDSLTSLSRIDQGRNVVGELGASHGIIEETRPFPRGNELSLTLQHSYDNLGSDYRYTQADLNLRSFFPVVRDQYLEYVLEVGYPVAVANRPLTSFYTAGGYRILRGYNFKEFRGDAIVYNYVSYNFPIESTRQEQKDKEWFTIVTWDIFAEAAKIGDKAIYTTPGDIKFSAGAGVGYRIVLFDRFPVHLELSAARAFEERPVKFYFTVSSIYYTWRK